MAIRYDKDVAFFEDICTVEEAEEFVVWIKEQKEPKLNLESLEHMHTALFQTILFFKPEILKLPNDNFFQDILCL